MKNFNHYVVVAKVEDMRIERAFPGPYSNAIVKIQEYLNNLEVFDVKYDSNQHSAYIYAHDTFDKDEEVTVIQTL